MIHLRFFFEVVQSKTGDLLYCTFCERNNCSLRRSLRNFSSLLPLYLIFARVWLRKSAFALAVALWIGWSVVSLSTWRELRSEI